MGAALEQLAWVAGTMHHVLAMCMATRIAIRMSHVHLVRVGRHICVCVRARVCVHVYRYVHVHVYSMCIEL